MGFSKKVKERALVASARHCCICHKSTGINIEVHHIHQAADGGKDTFENAIPLCFDCHANAGHYNDRHPKGIKYTSSELQAHRDNWYKIVQEGDLDFIEGERISTNYFMVSDLDGVKNILDGDTSRIKVEEALVYQNDILDFWKMLIGSHEYWSKRKYGDCIESGKQSGNVVTGDVLTIIETPSKDEIRDVSPLIDYLVSNNVDVDKFCRKYIYECACDGSTHIYYEFRDFAFLFVALRNQSGEDVYLNECTFDEIKEFELYNLSSEIIRECSYLMPPVTLKKGETVLVPCGILLKQFKSDGYKVINISSDISDIDHDCIDNRINKYTNQASLSFTFTVGKSLIPKSVSYVIDGIKYTENLRVLDMENLYLIDREFLMGSCPHLEFLSENNSIYLGELFSNEAEVSYYEVVAPSDGKVRLHEIEDEVTYINNIKLNGEDLYSDIVLHKGETLEIDCCEGDKVVFTGHYELEYDKKYYVDDPIHKRWKLSVLKGVPFNFA